MIRSARILAVALLLAGCDGGGGDGSDPAPSSSPSPALQPATPTIGLNSHSLQISALDELSALGVQHVRHTLYPHLWESSEPYRAEFRKNVALAFVHDSKLLLVVHPVPESWGPERFARWLQERVREFGPQIEAVQIGNEAYFGGGLEVHLAYHRVAYAAVKQANPSVTVVTLAIPTLEDVRAWDAPTDAFALHVYSSPPRPLSERMREVLAWLPAGERVWITEAGATVLEVGEEGQAREIRGAIEAAHGAERVYGYALQTDERGDYGAVELHGIVRPDGSRRPAALWLRGRLAP